MAGIANRRRGRRTHGHVRRGSGRHRQRRRWQRRCTFSTTHRAARSDRASDGDTTGPAERVRLRHGARTRRLLLAREPQQAGDRGTPNLELGRALSRRKLEHAIGHGQRLHTGPRTRELRHCPPRNGGSAASTTGSARSLPVRAARTRQASPWRRRGRGDFSRRTASITQRRPACRSAGGSASSSTSARRRDDQRLERRTARVATQAHRGASPSARRGRSSGSSSYFEIQQYP